MRLISLAPLLLLSQICCTQSYAIFGTSPKTIINELMLVLNSNSVDKIRDTTVSIMDSDYRIVIDERRNFFLIHVESEGRDIYDLELKGGILRVKTYHIVYACRINMETLRIKSIGNNEDSQPYKVFYKKDGSIRRVRAESEIIEKAILNRFSYNNTKDFVASTAPLDFLKSLMSR